MNAGQSSYSDLTEIFKGYGDIIMHPLVAVPEQRIVQQKKQRRTFSFARNRPTRDRRVSDGYPKGYHWRSSWRKRSLYQSVES
ncbi:hypothetical protein VPNG_00695 [Cytospora leucostoma]|uniref:Uncharacterized protein n=1 Tax=Cytospora leucostoma TaxID=1230097 RepID=A0A423XLS3_9PEZI|nr:hypothetical protein VPNG_00695 [Cytospora leucostoma]